MVSDREIEEFIEKYGDKIPNPEQYPRITAYYIKLYKWFRKQQKEN